MHDFADSRDDEDATGGSYDFLLRIENVSRVFPIRKRWWQTSRPLRAVDGVSLTLREGESIGLVGESGSGKTTLARLILRLDAPTSGTIEIAGRDIHRLSGQELRDHRERVQAVFQNPWSSLNPRLRVVEVISEPLIINSSMSKSRIKEVVRNLLQEMGLPPDSGERYPHQFSGGQRQRIALARALSCDPSLIVLDEPTSALDVSIRAQIINLLRQLQEDQGISFFVIAHDLATVRFIADKVAVMYLGEIVEYGPTRDLFESPRNPYTRSLISASIPASLSGDNEREDQLILGGEVPSSIDRPSGCPLHTRCWLYERLGRPDRCRTEKPSMTSVGSEHAAACHFSDRVPAVSGADGSR